MINAVKSAATSRNISILATSYIAASTMLAYWSGLESNKTQSLLKARDSKK